MTRYKLTIAYDGTRYCGWQVQKNGISIQSLIQEALQITLRHPVSLSGSGRTDAGVHAKGQVAHFDSDSPISNRTLLSLNAILPPDIKIFRIEEASSNFHARYSAVSKIYHYHLHLDKIADPFVRLYRYHVLGSCDLTLMERAIDHFLGTRDFTSFANEKDRGTASVDPIRTLSRIDLVQQKGGIRLEFEADGFLYKMVRNITGALISIGKGKTPLEEISEIFLSKDRRRAPMAAPPQGLFLIQVNYPSK